MPTAEITSIASCWADDLSTMQVDLLGVVDLRTILINFVERYNEADMVTGHYIRKHDLPHINAALMEQGLPQLGPKLTCDTKMDMHKKAGLPATQEYLSDILGLPIKKQYMSQVMWRDANRLTVSGIAATRQRVTSDVLQHMMLRTKMVEMGLLSIPKIWKP
jgi:hypothetical protein